MRLIGYSLDASRDRIRELIPGSMLTTLDSVNSSQAGEG